MGVEGVNALRGNVARSLPAVPDLRAGAWLRGPAQTGPGCPTPSLPPSLPVHRWRSGSSKRCFDKRKRMRRMQRKQAPPPEPGRMPSPRPTTQRRHSPPLRTIPCQVR